VGISTMQKQRIMAGQFVVMMPKGAHEIGLIA